LPAKQAPQLCSIRIAPPQGDGWLSEVKFDGYRMIATVDRGRARLLTRNGHDWTHLLPTVAKAISQLPVQAATLDGELVALRPDGVSSFPDLQAALKAGRDERLIFYAFDLLHLDGWDLRPCALIDRKRVLSGISNWSGVRCGWRRPLPRRHRTSRQHGLAAPQGASGTARYGGVTALGRGRCVAWELVEIVLPVRRPGTMLQSVNCASANRSAGQGRAGTALAPLRSTGLRAAPRGANGRTTHGAIRGPRSRAGRKQG
jgi:hypothetical protein